MTSLQYDYQQICLLLVGVGTPTVEHVDGMLESVCVFCCRLLGSAGARIIQQEFRQKLPIPIQPRHQQMIAEQILAADLLWERFVDLSCCLYV